MGVLVLLCCIIIYRVFYLREKAVIFMMIGLLTLGTVAAFVVANLVLQLFEVASVWSDLLNAAQNR